VGAIKEYIENWNKESKAFRWTKSADVIMGSIHKAKTAYSIDLDRTLGQSLRSFPRKPSPTFCQPWSLLRKALIRAVKTSYTAGTLNAMLPL
jgi:hypothetical protein